MKPRLPRWSLGRWLLVLTGMVVGGAVLAAAAVLFVFYEFGRNLPDYHHLANYEPPVATRIYAADGRLVADYARQDRLFVPYDAIPKRVVHAFLVAEDDAFFEHHGLDYLGIVRAALSNVRNFVADRRPVGASTITQQVAKNFLLTNEVSLERKIKEAILAFRIERAFTKEQILELYLNEIYLGMGSYGVASAALNYFDKSLDQLTVDEAAFLAALPKAPNNYHPERHHEAAMGRRNWVINRLRDEGYITAERAREAKARPLEMERPKDTLKVDAAYFTEEVRRFLEDRYGHKTLYEGGLQVRTTLNPDYQSLAQKSLRDGLISYDRRHGWRGPIREIRTYAWQEDLRVLDVALGRASWRLAAVIEVTEEAARVGFKDGSEGVVPFDTMTWARPWKPEQRIDARPDSAKDVVSPGDVIAVEPLEVAAPETASKGDGALRRYGLRQVPEVEGGIIALDPHSGRVLALVGGYDFNASQFNRATQALRQPGSAFKPFVYAAALEGGFTPSSLVLDAPFVIEQGHGQGKWKPANYSDKFYGPSTLRLGLEQSRNLMTVRLAQYIGMERITSVARRFGVEEHMPPILSMALGAGETTLMKLTTGYAMLANGGKRIEPALIERIQDRRGKTIYRRDKRDCPRCQVAAWDGGQPEPQLPDNRHRVIDPQTAYQMVSLMEGVVQRGTGVGARIGKPLAGKTGTSNDAQDAWFVGFSPNLVTGVFAGFDRPRTLGRGEQGATVAVPIFRQFMHKALEGKPGVPFQVPDGIRLVRVNAETGLPATKGDGNVILEAFKADTHISRDDRQVLDGSQEVVQTGSESRSSTGGIY